METIKATVEVLDEKHFIKIEAGDDEIRIPMSEDKPNDVKSAFNKLVARIKDAEFQIELEEVGRHAEADFPDEAARRQIIKCVRATNPQWG